MFLNDEVKQQLEAYNSQRMLYIMPHLEKVSSSSSSSPIPSTIVAAFMLTLPPPHWRCSAVGVPSEFPAAGHVRVGESAHAPAAARIERLADRR